MVKKPTDAPRIAIVVTRTERCDVSIPESVLADIIRRAVDAPPEASVDIEKFEGAIVSWSVSREESR